MSLPLPPIALPKSSTKEPLDGAHQTAESNVCDQSLGGVSRPLAEGQRAVRCQFRGRHSVSLVFCAVSRTVGTSVYSSVGERTLDGLLSLSEWEGISFVILTSSDSFRYTDNFTTVHGRLECSQVWHERAAEAMYLNGLCVSAGRPSGFPLFYLNES